MLSSKVQKFTEGCTKSGCSFAANLSLVLYLRFKMKERDSSLGALRVDSLLAGLSYPAFFGEVFSCIHALSKMIS